MSEGADTKSESEAPTPGCTGTYGSWKRGCRCDRCIEAKKAKRRLWKAKRKGLLLEEGKLVFCPVCEVYLDSWRSQALHERRVHTPRSD